MVQQARHRQNLVAVRPLGRSHLQTTSQNFAHVLTEVSGYRIILARKHLSIQALHRLCPERRHFHNHFVKDAACAPNVTPVIVRLIFPNLGARIVWRSCLRTHHSTFGDSGDVHIAKLDDAFLGEEDVGTLDVSVADSKVMERLEASDNLDEKVPDLLLGET